MENKSAVLVALLNGSSSRNYRRILPDSFEQYFLKTDCGTFVNARIRQFENSNDVRIPLKNKTPKKQELEREDLRNCTFAETSFSVVLCAIYLSAIGGEPTQKRARQICGDNRRPHWINLNLFTFRLVFW